MFGFGIALMHIADYFTRRKYDKKERISKSEEEYTRKKSEPRKNEKTSPRGDLLSRGHIGFRI
jgi:hypothetical protein